jgi:hypothetical protein
MRHLSLKQIAHALNGDVRNGQVLAPGPGHSAKDRSLSITLSDTVDEGFIVTSFSNKDDWKTCKDYVLEKLGLPKFQPKAGRRNGDDVAQLMQEAIASQRKTSDKAFTKAYDYQDQDGTLLYQMLRYEKPKRFAYRQPDGHGDWIYKAPHRRVIYRWPELLQYHDATTFVCEGEKDADNVIALGACATTVASGKWTDDCVQVLTGRDIWILEDNDDTGRKKALDAAKLLQPVAKSIKIIRLPGLGEGGDISDWLDAGHLMIELEGVCYSTPDWEPADTKDPTDTKQADDKPLPASKSLVAFPLVAFEHVTLNSGRDYLVKDLLPRAGLCLIWGPRKCGKSFWAMDLALHVALGWNYRGRKVQQAPIVYLALEGHGGYPRRIEAFRQHHKVKTAPFYLLRATVNLAAKADQLIKDIEAQLGEEKPGAIFIDTLNRSLVGSESSDEDISKYLNAAGKIQERFNCCVVIIHHCGYDESHPRGHTALSASVDVQIAVTRGTDLEVIATVELAKDGPEGAVIYSHLHPMPEVGRDPDGDPIGSLVVLPADKPATARVTVPLNDRQRNALDALALATLGYGVPPSFELPASINRVVKIDEWRKAMFANGTLNQNDANPRSDFTRLRTQLKAHGAIGIHGDFVWRSP